MWSCCSLLGPDTTVVTVCAGVPPAGTPPTAFDTRAGAHTPQQAMRWRLAEDHAAARRLGFRPVHLTALDRGYGGHDIETAIAAALAKAVGETVVAPLGLHHPDHVAVADAVRDHGKSLDVWLYEDLPYARLWPEEIPGAVARTGCATQFVEVASPAGKRAAVEDYRTQAKGCHMDEILAPERFHFLYGTGTLP